MASGHAGLRARVVDGTFVSAELSRRTVAPGAGGTSWANALMQRVVAGEGYWARFAAQQPTVYLSSVPLGTAVASGELALGFAPLIAT